MGFSYYVLGTDGSTRQNLDPQDSSLLKLLITAKQGEIYIDVPNETNIKYKITYDVDTADVDVLDAASPAGVTAYFNDERTKEMRIPIYNAINVLAKVDLLNKLYTLGDGEICKVISKNNFDKNHEQIRNLSLDEATKAISQTLTEILAISYSKKPADQHAMFKTKESSGKKIQEVIRLQVTTVNSLKKVTELMDKIQSALKTPEPKAAASRPTV